ncbi:MAG: hypothetical protein KJZ73_16600 [Pseudorhodoplanes sp.]|nr:hypothetical protein [Pseudorhodoplanes sp.]
MTPGRILTTVAAACTALGASAQAAEKFEKPRSFPSNLIPGISAAGQNYTIASPVTSDGFMRIYRVKTPYGDFEVIGDALMRARQFELAALRELDQVTNSEAFNKALAEAGLSPIRFAGQLLVNPLGTVGNTLSGIGSLFGQIGSSAHNAGKVQGDPIADLTGASRRKRELAVKLGVDPYTDFPPLQDKLTQLSQAAATGGLLVSGALMAIPGVGGLIVSNASTSANLTNMARDSTPAQLLDIGRQKLAAMGVDAKLTEVFLTNRNYTPLDAAIIVTSLEAIPVAGRDVFISRAASVGRRDAAFFMRRQAELLAEYQEKTGVITGFVPLGGFPFTLTRSGVMGFLPLDALSWTENTGRAMRDITDSMKRLGRAGKAELRITGQATPLAKQQLKALGWTVVDSSRI